MVADLKTIQSPSEGDPQATQGNPQGDLSENFVPKEKYTADLTAMKAEQETALQSLQRSLEDAQATLTSPEYLKYLAEKRAGTNAKRGFDTPATDKELRDRLANLEVISSQLAATIELQEAERKYSDFKDYRSDVQSIINANGNLSFEQAYLIAKGKRPLPNAPTKLPAQGDKQTTGTEKPGKFVPDPSSTEKEFKTTAEASSDVARHMREKYGISDTL